MNIYLVERKGPTGYDAYSSFVCFAETEEEAKQLHPRWGIQDPDIDYSWDITWSPMDASITFLGVLSETVNIANTHPIICASFNAD